MSDALLSARLLNVTFGTGAHALHAVKDVSIDVAAGETLGLVGESGSGKSTLGRALLRLIEPSAGQVLFRGEDILNDSPAQLRVRRRAMQMVFQDPSLNPRRRIGDMLAEVLDAHGLHKGATRTSRVHTLLDQVGLSAEYARRFPHECSGGQKQRIGIARALAVEPALLIADEPTSALDVSIQAQVLALLRTLKHNLNLTLLFISHDLDVIHEVADRVAVMYLGRIVEIAPTDVLFSNPRHPYTKALLSAAPIADPAQPAPQVAFLGEPPSPRNPPSGCAFRTRCPHANDGCAAAVPVLETLAAQHSVACVRHHELLSP